MRLRATVRSASGLVRLAGAMAIPAGDLVEGIHWTPAPSKFGTFTFGTPPRGPED